MAAEKKRRNDLKKRIRKKTFPKHFRINFSADGSAAGGNKKYSEIIGEDFSCKNKGDKVKFIYNYKLELPQENGRKRSKRWSKKKTTWA